MTPRPINLPPKPALIDNATGCFAFTESQLRAAIEADRAAAPMARAEGLTWRAHVEQRLHSWRQRFINKSGDQLALDDFMDARSIDDLLDYVLDEWAAPPTQPDVDAIMALADAYANAEKRCWQVDVNKAHLRRKEAEAARETLRSALGGGEGKA